MKVHVVNIGDEILIGQVVNTNASYICSRLIECQAEPAQVTVVGDNKEDIIREFTENFDKFDVTIVTGGLGPTHDDITIKCISEFFGSKLILNQHVLDDLQSFFDRRGRKMSESNKSQAMVPEIAEILHNKKGTAPGTWIERNKRIMISLPGVPHEMKAMLDEYVLPVLFEKSDKEQIIKIKNLLTTGIPESTLSDRLGNIDELLKGAKLAFLPNTFGVRLRITVTEKNEELAANHLSEIEQKIRTLVGRFIYGTEDVTMEEVVGRLLKERGLNISVAESCTGGLISSRLTNIDGSSKYFERGVVTYSNGAKVELLKVNEDTIAQYGAVSPEVAEQMAQGIRSVSGTDIGLAVTGILGPTGAAPGKPLGLVYICLCDDKKSFTRKFIFGEERILNKERASQAALDMLRRYLLGIPNEE